MLSFAIRSDKLKIEKADLCNLPECNACITTHTSTTFCCYCFLGSSYVHICDKRDCRGGKTFHGMKGYLQIHLKSHLPIARKTQIYAKDTYRIQTTK